MAVNVFGAAYCVFGSQDPYGQYTEFLSGAKMGGRALRCSKARANCTGRPAAAKLRAKALVMTSV